MTYALLCEGKDEKEIKALDAQLTLPRSVQRRDQARAVAASFDWANDG